MSQSDQAIEDLQAYREMLVATRRRMVSVGVHGNKNTARVAGAPYEVAVGPTTARSAEVRALQDDIEAVNRAILDEQNHKAVEP